jgi:hypothetical protein
MVFYVTPGINADTMVYREDGRLCKVEGPPPKVENNAAPIGDNKNLITHYKDYVAFPRLYQGKGLPPLTIFNNTYGFPKSSKPKGEQMPKPGDTPKPAEIPKIEQAPKKRVTPR